MKQHVHWTVAVLGSYLVKRHFWLQALICVYMGVCGICEHGLGFI